MDPSDVARYRPIVSSAISPDGSQVAVAVPSFDEAADARPTKLYLFDLDRRGAARPVGGRRALSHSGPVFCADSRTLLAFRSDGRATDLVAVDVGDPEGAPRVLAAPPPSPSALRVRGPQSQPCALGDDEAGWRRLHVWPESGEAPTPLTPAGVHCGDYAWSPDGERLAWLPIPSLDSPESERLPIRMVDGAGHAERPMRVPGRPIGYLAWSPDGRWLAYLARRAGQRLSAAQLWIVDPSRWPGDGDAARCLTRDSPAQITGFDWSAGGDTIALAVVEGTYGRLYRQGLDGTRRPIGPRRTYLSGPHHDRSRGRLVHLGQDGGAPQRLYARDEDEASSRAVTHFERGIRAKVVAEAETVSWSALDGLALDGVLYRPAEPGPAPLLVWLHGGPAEAMTRTFSPYFQVFARAGFAVFAPNFRGSAGRDEAFLRASVGDLGGADVDDVLSGIDRLVQMGVAQPERTALVGWSYGGTLALHAARKSSVPRALCVGAPVVDWVAFFGAARMPMVYGEYFRAPFWDDRAPFDAASPISWVRDIDVPTLILHGSADAVVPVSQSRLLYRALKARGVETDLMVYPGESHVLGRPSAVADMLERILAWCLGRV
ncbi:MAG: S9 family peptidase [Myxococcota bacterium]